MASAPVGPVWATRGADVHARKRQGWPVEGRWECARGVERTGGGRIPPSHRLVTSVTRDYHLTRWRVNPLSTVHDKGTPRAGRWQGCALLAMSLVGAACSHLRPCGNPVPIRASGEETGFVRCDGGWVHRERRSNLPVFSPRSDAECRTAGESCRTDGDCADGTYGRCIVRHLMPPGFVPCHCEYGGCVSDAECGAGEICAPPEVTHENVGVCVAASCSTDADCAGSLCASGSGRMFACQRREDECDTADDCIPYWRRYALGWPGGSTAEDFGYRCTRLRGHNVCLEGVMY